MNEVKQPATRLRKFAAVLHAVRTVSRQRGIVRTLRLALSEFLFDLRHGTSTSLDFSKMATPQPDTQGVYEGANPLLFNEAMRRTCLNPAKSVFLDFGAGKGRALLLASKHGFRKVIGVERSEKLYEIARENIATFLRRHPDSRIEVHHCCATGYEVPEEVNVAYFFNPFGAAEMKATTMRIVESISRLPRELDVIYLVPRFRDVLIQLGFEPTYYDGKDVMILRYRHSHSQKEGTFEESRHV